MKIASIEKPDGQVALFLGRERLSLERLPADAVERLSRLSTPLLIEVTLEGSHVVALGKVLPNPRVAALRAAADSRFGAALEALAELGDGVDGDLELLGARMRARFGVGQVQGGEADFVAYCQHSAATPHDLEAAFRVVPEASHATCVPALVRRVESTDVPNLRPFVLTVGTAAAWSAETLLRCAEQSLTERSPEEWLLAEVEGLLASATGRTEDRARIDAIVALVASGRKKLADRARKQAAQLLAARPSFDDVASLFAITLPAPLRAAWERHYEGHSVGFGFIEVKKGKLDKLTTLSTKLLKDLTKAETLDGQTAPVLPEGLPFRLLPFGVGEHADEFFALDLCRPTGDGDFAVVVVFARRGEAWLNNPTSAAWLSEGGVTRY